MSTPPSPRGGRLSLKARAISFLARREHSRLELQRKLAVGAACPDDIPAVLDALESEGLLSNERFAHSLVNRRAAGKGVRLVTQELRQHGLDPDLIADLHASLAQTESERAQQVWQKKFGVLPNSPKDYARQVRFLASRGFSSSTIQSLLGAIPSMPSC